MKVFSPYQTKLWLECPIKRILSTKERWVLREIGALDMAGILGTAIGAGLEVYNLKGDQPAQAAMAEANKLCELALTPPPVGPGRTLPPKHEAQWANIPGRAEAAVTQYAELADMNGGLPPGLPEGSEIVAVEQSYGPAGGYMRPDLIVKDSRAPRVPFDYKHSLSLGQKPGDRDFIRAKKVSGWSNDVQFMSYSRHEGVLHYYVGHLISEPTFQYETLDFVIHPETMRAFNRAITQTWKDMEDEDAGRRAPLMASRHSDEFGPCPFEKACFTHHWDWQLMGQDYVRVPKTPWRG